MAHPVVGHQDPGEVRVVVEDDPEEVVSLALVPVGRRKHVLHRIDLRRITVDKRADPQLLKRFEITKLVHDLEPLRPSAGGVGEMVDAGQKGEQAIALRPQTGQRLPDALRLHGYPGVAGADAAVDYQSVGDHWRGLIPWALMRSCRIIRALGKASGRGGQPGM